MRERTPSAPSIVTGGRGLRAASLVGLGLLFSLLLGLPASANGQTSPVAPFDSAETCGGKPEGADCWKQLASHPGCYVWDQGFVAEQTVTWSGECSDGLAQGTGVREWTTPDDDGHPQVHGGEGEMRDGRPHGPWSHYYSTGGMAEGGYEHGERNGPWMELYPDGTLFEGEWANGQRRGKWTSSYGDDTGGGFYVAGKEHGPWRLLIVASDNPEVRGVREGVYVAGEQDGRWVTRFESGTEHERTYRRGQLHGPSSSNFADGSRGEGTHENGEKHGQWKWWNADGKPTVARFWVNGKKHGLEVQTAWSDQLFSTRTETPWENGEIHGTVRSYWRLDHLGSSYRSGWLVEEEAPFVNGLRHGTVVAYAPMDDGRIAPLGREPENGIPILRKTPFVRGVRHGISYSTGQAPLLGYWGGEDVPESAVMEETPYVNGERHGTVIYRDVNNNVVHERHFVNGEER